MSKYTTHNIDEATYLVIKGLKHTSKKLGVVSSNYTFEHTPQLERYRKEFWGKSPKVSLHTWLSTRAGLKNEMRNRPLAVERTRVRVNSKTGFSLVNGQYYWSIVNGAVIRSQWGEKNAAHQERLKAGNVYQSHEEATKALTQ